jgi:hypothetical protein
MSYRIPKPAALFDGNVVQNFQALKGLLIEAGNEGIRMRNNGEVLGFTKGVGVVLNEDTLMRKMLSESPQIQALLTKSGLTPDAIKEWSLGSPIAQTPIQYTGITPYFVEGALLMLIPKDLHFRNRTPREKGIGQGIEYRRLTAVTNSGGAQPNVSPFFSSTSNTITVNGVTLNRPNQIAYSGDATFKPFVEMGYSDSVSMQQQFAAQGFTDAQAVSMLALLWADMLGEERALLNGRSTVLPITSFAATVAADSLAVNAGLPSGTATAVYITASTPQGESQAITATGTPVVSAVIGVKATVLTSVPAGTIALNFYVNMSGTYYKGTTVATIVGAYATGASPATYAVVAALPSTSADNGSGSTLGYDGAITEYSNASLGGYQLALNSVLSTSNPGGEFETALETLYTNQGADPDAIYFTGAASVALYNLLKNNAQNVSYRINLQTGENGVIMGGSVGGVVNPATSKMVDFIVHRYMPNGVAVIQSWEVPWADSGVTSCMKVVNTVDTMVIDWPQIGMSYDRSTYRYGTCVFEAPVLSGVITGIFNG